MSRLVVVSEIEILTHGSDRCSLKCSWLIGYLNARCRLFGEDCRVDYGSFPASDPAVFRCPACLEQAREVVDRATIGDTRGRELPASRDGDEVLVLRRVK